MDKVESVIISDDNLLTNAFKTLSVFRENGELCDVVLKTDDGITIPAHKVVLSASSPYFRAMFTLNFVESTSLYIDMKNVHGIALRDMVNYFYTGRLCVNHLNVIGVIELCHVLQIDGLIERCEVFLRRNLSTRNSLGLQAFARHYSLAGLKDHAMRFSCWNFSHIKEEEEFFLMPQNELKQLIAHDTLKAPSEEHVLEAAVKWLVYDFDNREEQFEELLTHIRFPLMSQKYLLESELIKYIHDKFPTSSNLITKAVDYHSQHPGLDNIFELKNFSPRLASEDIFVIGGWSNGQKLSTVQCFNVDTLKWTSVNNMNIAHVAKEHYFRVIVSQDELYTVGFNKVMKYDPVESVWYKFADGPEVQCKWAGVCEYNNGFYVIGGSTNKSSKCFNIQKATWEDLPAGHHARYYPGIAVMNENLYVIGGLDNKWRPLKVCERYDPRQRKWIEIAKLRSPRWNLGVATLRNRLYAIGGNHNLEHFANTVEVYDPKEDIWDRSVAPMNCGRRCLGVAVVNDLIYVVGGRVTNTIECYDEDKDEWKIVGSVNSCCNFGCVALRLI